MSARTKRILLGYSVVALLLFGGLTALASQIPYFAFDPPITRAIQALHTPWLDTLMDAAGQPGSPPQTLYLNAIIVLIFFVFGLWREGLTLLIFIPLIGTIGTFVRETIHRPRPDAALVLFLLHPNADRMYSFPSGHTVNFVAVLGFVIYVAYKKLPPSPVRTGIVVVAAVFMVLIPLSRIYVGDHWTSDVIAGALLGSVFLVWMILFYEWLEARAARSERAKQHVAQTSGSALER